MCHDIVPTKLKSAITPRAFCFGANFQILTGLDTPESKIFQVIGSRHPFAGGK